MFQNQYSAQVGDKYSHILKEYVDHPQKYHKGLVEAAQEELGKRAVPGYTVPVIDTIKTL